MIDINLNFTRYLYLHIKANISKQNILNLYNSNQKLIEIVSNEFLVDKNLLLALMGIETNFGTYLEKMDIVSSLATLSFDKRRSKFTSELITLLKLVDANIMILTLCSGLGLELLVIFNLCHQQLLITQLIITMIKKLI